MDIGSGGTRSSGKPPVAEVAATPTRRKTLTALRPFHQFYVTSAVPCPYVEGRAERKLIVELSGRAAPGFYDTLSRAGFRRSHRFAYRPACRACSACVPVRIAVEHFAHTRSTRRVRNTHTQMTGTVIPPNATIDQFRLFIAYQHSRHRDSEMAMMTYSDYRGMVEDTELRTGLVEFREPDGTLVAMSLIDELDDGFSAVYSFYDPDHKPGSLGTWAILWLVDEARRNGLPYVYLGYWIGESPKMAYKARFPALERFAQGRWTPFTDETAG